MDGYLHVSNVIKEQTDCYQMDLSNQVFENDLLGYY